MNQYIFLENYYNNNILNESIFSFSKEESIDSIKNKLSKIKEIILSKLSNNGLNTTDILKKIKPISKNIENDLKKSNDSDKKYTEKDVNLFIQKYETKIKKIPIVQKRKKKNAVLELAEDIMWMIILLTFIGAIIGIIVGGSILIGQFKHYLLGMGLTGLLIWAVIILIKSLYVKNALRK